MAEYEDHESGGKADRAGLNGHQNATGALMQGKRAAEEVLRLSLMPR